MNIDSPFDNTPQKKNTSRISQKQQTPLFGPTYFQDLNMDKCLHDEHTCIPPHKNK